MNTIETQSMNRQIYNIQAPNVYRMVRSFSRVYYVYANNQLYKYNFRLFSLFNAINTKIADKQKANAGPNVSKIAAFTCLICVKLINKPL